VNCVAGLSRRLWQHVSVFQAKRPAMRAFKEVSIDLTADELLSALLPPAPANVEPAAEQDTVEIELTAEEMDALLSLGSPPARG
jgi:hypothetical protein